MFKHRQARRTGNPAPQRSPLARWRPSFEVLEDRCTPALFSPADVSELISSINTANSTAADDVIDLGGQTFTLTAVDNTTDGPNGLPSVLDAATAGTLTIRNGVIERGGTASFRILHVAAGADVTLEGVTVRGGFLNGPNGGGILNLGNLTVLDSTLSNNAAGRGGSIYNDGGTVTVRNSSLIENSTVAGGGIYQSSGTLTVSNSTFDDNYADNHGGGIAVAGGTLSLLNSTLAFNRANGDNTGGRGGGLYVAATGSALLHNTIVARNSMLYDPASTGRDIFGALNSTSSYNLIGRVEGLTGISDGSNGNQIGTNAVPIDPLLGPLQNNGGPTLTRAIDYSSPAFNAGDPAFTPPPATDQRGTGFPRVAFGRLDIGAFEFFFDTSSLVVDILEDEFDDNFDPGDLSLREAVFLANLDDDANTITFADGLTGVISLDSTLGQLEIKTNLTITGPGARLLAIDGGDETRVFRVDDGTDAVKTVILEGLTITQGYSDGTGGGIYNFEDLTVRASTLSDSTALEGGGIANYGGTVTVEGSTLSGNVAGYVGGGIANLAGGTLTLRNSTFFGNSAIQMPGGGIFNEGTAMVQSSTLSGNAAHTGHGGGIYNFLGTLTLDNTIVANSTIGHDIENDDKGVVNGSFNLIESISGSGTNNLTNTIDEDPQLGALQNNGGPTDTMAITTSSPAFNAGDNHLVVSADDQRGESRVQGFVVDIGAYELSILLVTINQANTQADPTSTSPIVFRVVFSAPVSNFATGDVTLGGTAGATMAIVTPHLIGGTSWNVAVSGMTKGGTVIAAIAAGVASKLDGTLNQASTSTDNVVTFHLNVTSRVRLLWPASYTKIAANQFRGVFTITNLSNQTIQGPIRLSWPTLPNGVTVVSSTSIASLAPGKTATVTVVFKNLSNYPLGNLKFYFKPVVLAG